jgi:hypothetical protein
MLRSKNKEEGLMRRHALLVLCCLTFVACMKPKGSEYLGKAGARYEYSIEYPGLAGVQHASMVVRSDKEETIQGKRYTRVVVSFSGLPGLDQQVSYSRLTGRGAYTIDGDNKDKPEYLDTPLPLEVGTHWTSNGPSSQSSFEVVGAESMEAANETFEKCLKITFKRTDKNGSSEGTEYLAPKIGLVKMYTRSADTPMTFSLVKYK